jgi:subtilase family serine protease
LRNHKADKVRGLFRRQGVKLKNFRLVSLLLLAFLVLCTFVVPQAYAATSSNVDDNSDWNTGSTYHYEVNPKVAKTQGYESGFMGNTVFELRNAYDLNPLYASGYDGKGQTVVIVDAYGSPTIYQDLLTFIQWQNTYNANLPWTTMAEVKNHLRIYYPLGKPAFDPTDPNQLLWSTEVTLDVDMVHAIAPKADIALVIAPNDGNKALDYCVRYAINHQLGSTISLSWGTPEYALTGPAELKQVQIADNIYKSAAYAGITVFASAGDWGSSNGASANNVLFPSSDPYVTAVGGTNLFMTCSDGFAEGTQSWDGQNHIGIKYSYEIVGNDYQAMVADGFPAPFDFVTTGGAASSLFPLPSWQKGITLTDTQGNTIKPTGRCTSDVSFNGGVYGGLGAVFLSAASPGSPKPAIVGGTSAGAPFWAALTAIACQISHHSLGFINPQLYENKNAFYKSGAFHDITVGDNTYPSDNTVLGYMATRGWDAPTGIGSPDAALLAPKMSLWDNPHSQKYLDCSNNFGYRN